MKSDQSAPSPYLLDAHFSDVTEEPALTRYGLGERSSPSFYCSEPSLLLAPFGCAPLHDFAPF
jgi:hypothetical protein